MQISKDAKFKRSLYICESSFVMKRTDGQNVHDIFILFLIHPIKKVNPYQHSLFDDLLLNNHKQECEQTKQIIYQVQGLKNWCTSPYIFVLLLIQFTVGFQL